MKAIMILGTMSNSGKSFITAGLLRVLKKDGYKVCPFKSQNMALNSYITKEGHEIGMAQAMQARACGIEPSVYMNPILLKPNSDTGSQVIVGGKVLSNMSAKDYFAKKKELIPYIKEAYEKLQEEYDICVIEGAGSPAEINLKENDIVNLGLADIIDCNAILVGDIDRGGVFAALYGTVELLEEHEKKRIKGLVINKFRGDVSILKPGLDMIEKKLGKKVLGTVPMKRIDIADEDSLSERLTDKKTIKAIDIAVIRFPHISNFTDFDILERFDNVSLRYVNTVAEFGNPDIIILPGTKNTIDDLLAIRQNGLESLIYRSAKDKLIIGICGGYQMLGKDLKDPYNMESGLETKGIGLLNAGTIFEKDKKTVQISGKILESTEFLTKDSIVKGYEIHLGKTIGLGEDRPLLELEDGRMDGLIAKTGNVVGTYLHGIFDNEDFVYDILSYVAGKKGISLEKPINMEEYIEKEYDKLENLIRENVDMNEIYRIIGIDR